MCVEQRIKRSTTHRRVLFSLLKSEALALRKRFVSGLFTFRALQEPLSEKFVSTFEKWIRRKILVVNLKLIEMGKVKKKKVLYYYFFDFVYTSRDSK